MEIVNVNIVRMKKEGNLKAFASINLDDEIVIRGLKVIDGRFGLFVSFPSEKGADEKYYNTFYALNDDTRDYITQTVLDAFEKDGEKEEKPKRGRSGR